MPTLQRSDAQPAKPNSFLCGLSQRQFRTNHHSLHNLLSRGIVSKQSCLCSNFDANIQRERAPRCCASNTIIPVATDRRNVLIETFAGIATMLHIWTAGTLCTRVGPLPVFEKVRVRRRNILLCYYVCRNPDVVSPQEAASVRAVLLPSRARECLVLYGVLSTYSRVHMLVQVHVQLNADFRLLYIMHAADRR